MSSEQDDFETRVTTKRRCTVCGGDVMVEKTRGELAYCAPCAHSFCGRDPAMVIVANAAWPRHDAKPNETIPDERLVNAFVQGAKWWEWHKTNCTMWQSDQALAEAEALKLLAAGTLGLSHDEMLARMYELPEVEE